MLFLISLLSLHISGLGSHRKPDDQSTFNELMWVVSQNLSILAGSWLGLVGVYDQVRWSTIWALLRHERVFQAGGETSSSSSSETGFLDFINDPILSIG